MDTLNFQAEEQNSESRLDRWKDMAWRLKIDYCTLMTDMPLSS